MEHKHYTQVVTTKAVATKFIACSASAKNIKARAIHINMYYNLFKYMPVYIICGHKVCKFYKEVFWHLIFNFALNSPAALELF